MIKIINIFLISLTFLLWFLLAKKFVSAQFASVKVVKAEVADKYKMEAASKIRGTFKRDSYIVVFKANDKKLSFAVSEFSYNHYKIKSKGTLKYKGNKIISFD